MYVCMHVRMCVCMCVRVCAAVGKAYEALQDEEQVAFCKDIAEEAKKQLETRVRVVCVCVCVVVSAVLRSCKFCTTD